ncbi:hypothetical protein F4803DRAFT_67673 [Xylaria telfairii]|nr:hypothetical protein F4803DRAFT_67673 [Xylaria telfairii]
MLPSRGLARTPASALRYSFSSRIKPTPTSTLSTRQFSQSQSQSQSQSHSHSSILSRRLLSRVNASQYGRTTPSISVAGYGASVGIASSSVFAQRSGAARNLSLWPFQSKSQTPPTPQTPEAPQTTETRPEWVSESPAPSPAEVFPPAEPNPMASSEPDLSQLSDDLLRAFDSQSLLDPPPHIGYLSELGLDYGWGSTSCCQWIVEHLHVYSGMPWWATIATIALLFRGVMFYPSLIGAKHQARIQALNATPEFKKAKAEFQDATLRTKDRRQMLEARATLRRLQKAADASSWKPFVNFAMIPFSWGMFRLFRGMADVPVPGMDTGGLAWFTDLTVHDPLYLLPAIAVGLTAVTLKQTQRATVAGNEMQQNVGKLMMYIMPPMMFLGTAFLPSALQFFFVVISLGTATQAQATINPSIRRWAELPPLVNHNASKMAIQYQSPSKRFSLEDGITAASQSIKEATGATDDKARLKKAQDYEDQRAEEERQKAMRRMDEVRRRRAGRQL